MANIKEITLYSYFYSSAAWRVRSVLELKKIPYKYELVHLLNGQQHSGEYLKVNPMHQAPSMKLEFQDGQTQLLTQSLAIIQFLEENYPQTASVLPEDSVSRAKTRAIADTISGGIQPLQNLETLLRYGEPLGLGELDADQRKKIAQYWIGRKMENLEQLVARTAGKFCVGDSVTVADCCLVPQMFNARRFEVDTNRFPLLKRIDEELQKLEMFKVSHPYNCPDCPADLKAQAPK